ncbi:MAG: aminotransferase class IV [Pirellulaceae bacterium]|jgi:branched-subunit amino acid aminotransferase/4-amino-4-deoxychorismate lyase|nr:aminotransferase class IV [Pirellulaceae bacterium]MDP7018540.1 aminotransferase class IV [Pirellulaceae bacterium]
MAEPLAYLKGEFVPASQCVLPIYDLGIVLGAAVTDFLRTFHQQPYRMEDHVRRFHRSCHYARIEAPVDVNESMAIAERLLTENSKLTPDDELGLVFYMTAGENTVYAGASGMPAELTATYVQHTFPLRFNLWKQVFLDGVHCVTPAPRHWPPQCLSSKIKNRNRLHMWIGEQEVRALDPHAMPVYLDINGNLTETGGSNFVIYRDGKVVSPKRSNILWGVSLSVLSDIVVEMGMAFVEDDIQTYDVVNAEEVWLPTTPYCLGPVTKFNGSPIGDGRPGPVWRRVLERWSELVGKDIYRETAEAN